jgi:sigma-B regulation protein RsbU (phosphoserine phosphatase)
VRNSTERAQRLIEELLDFTQARVGSGLAVSMRTVDRHEVVSRAVEELRLTFPYHTILHPSAGPGDCFADPDRLAQLVGNVSNAAAYGLSTAPITLATTVRTDRATLSVHKEGQPIPTEALDRIFEPMPGGARQQSRSQRGPWALHRPRDREGTRRHDRGPPCLRTAPNSASASQ